MGRRRDRVGRPAWRRTERRRSSASSSFRSDRRDTRQRQRRGHCQRDRASGAHQTIMATEGRTRSTATSRRRGTRSMAPGVRCLTAADQSLIALIRERDRHRIARCTVVSDLDAQIRAVRSEVRAAREPPVAPRGCRSAGAPAAVPGSAQRARVASVGSTAHVTPRRYGGSHTSRCWAGSHGAPSDNRGRHRSVPSGAAPGSH